MDKFGEVRKKDNNFIQERLQTIFQLTTFSVELEHGELSITESLDSGDTVLLLGRVSISEPIIRAKVNEHK